jgi:UDP-glucose 4-epimerase
LDDVDGLSRAFDTAEVVVHLAARVHVMQERAPDPLAAFRQVNVEGTRSVGVAARKAGVRRIVYLSSIKAMGEGKPTPYRETDQPAPADPYGVSKLEAEQVLAGARASGGVEFVVLRPTLVYGPGVGGNFRRILSLAALARRVPLPLGRIPNQRSLVSVANLVSAIIACTRHAEARDRTFLVSDGEDLSTSDLLRALAEGLGGRAMLLPCPTGLMRAVASAIGHAADADRLLGSLTVDSGLVRRVLGWQPPQSVAQGLRETAAWWAAGAQEPK